jgi:hypothetical protein
VGLGILNDLSETLSDKSGDTALRTWSGLLLHALLENRPGIEEMVESNSAFAKIVSRTSTVIRKDKNPLVQGIAGLIFCLTCYRKPETHWIPQILWQIEDPLKPSVGAINRALQVCSIELDNGEIGYGDGRPTALLVLLEEELEFLMPGNGFNPLIFLNLPLSHIGKIGLEKKVRVAGITGPEAERITICLQSASSMDCIVNGEVKRARTVQIVVPSRKTAWEFFEKFINATITRETTRIDSKNGPHYSFAQTGAFHDGEEIDLFEPDTDDKPMSNEKGGAKMYHGLDGTADLEHLNTSYGGLSQQDPAEVIQKAGGERKRSSNSTSSNKRPKAAAQDDLTQHLQEPKGAVQQKSKGGIQRESKGLIQKESKRGIQKESKGPIQKKSKGAIPKESKGPILRVGGKRKRSSNSTSSNKRPKAAAQDDLTEHHQEPMTSQNNKKKEQLSVSDKTISKEAVDTQKCWLGKRKRRSTVSSATPPRKAPRIRENASESDMKAAQQKEASDAKPRIIRFSRQGPINQGLTPKKKQSIRGKMETPAPNPRHRSTPATVNGDGSPIPVQSSQADRGANDSIFMGSADSDEGELDYLVRPETPRFGSGRSGYSRAHRSALTTSSRSSGSGLPFVTSTRKAVPSSPRAPSRMLQDMVCHQELASGKFRNVKNAEVVKAGELEDPFMTGQSSKGNLFFEKAEKERKARSTAGKRSSLSASSFPPDQPASAKKSRLSGVLMGRNTVPEESTGYSQWASVQPVSVKKSRLAGASASSDTVSEENLGRSQWASVQPSVAYTWDEKRSPAGDEIVRPILRSDQRLVLETMCNIVNASTPAFLSYWFHADQV